MMYNKFQVKLMPWVAKFATSFLCAVALSKIRKVVASQGFFRLLNVFCH